MTREARYAHGTFLIDIGFVHIARCECVMSASAQNITLRQD